MTFRSSLLFIALLGLFGCGDPALEPIDSDYVFKRTKICTELSGSKPSIEYIDKIIWPLGSDTAHYDSSKRTVLIRSDYALSYDVHAHEFIHHLLSVNNFYVDTCHSNSLFKKCATTTAGYSC